MTFLSSQVFNSYFLLSCNDNICLSAFFGYLLLGNCYLCDFISWHRNKRFSSPFSIPCSTTNILTLCDFITIISTISPVAYKSETDREREWEREKNNDNKHKSSFSMYLFGLESRLYDWLHFNMLFNAVGLKQFIDKISWKGANLRKWISVLNYRYRWLHFSPLIEFDGVQYLKLKQC